jgi:hypothetical protein
MVLKLTSLGSGQDVQGALCFAFDMEQSIFFFLCFLIKSGLKLMQL